MVEKEFMNRFLRDMGYKQYICRKCGGRFWSIISRDTCPDRPCSKYDFLYKKYPRVSKLGLDEARRRFIDYFIRNNHGYVKPYPVLARWRNDLYLTIASIIVFQPAVTDGIVDPPYNPLVIVQPSIRLEDIDNVGLTFGRHMTSFEMGGHHAFNKGDKRIYWVEETLRYAYEFFTREIGIDPEDLVFKESWWEGGGNAGPAYEVLVDGLELATLVFMKYKIVDNKKVLNPVLVVDTGYGIERITWFTQKTPTAFHAVYDKLVNQYIDALSVEEPPHDVLMKITYLLSDKEVSSIYDFKKYIDEAGLGNYYEEIVNSINIYTTLDHVRTIMLMLSDGIVPSNTGEGYLARLVIRRLFRTLLRLGVEVSKLEDIVLELADLQARYWKGRYVYDKFHRNMEYISDVLSIESRKYIDLITRGVREVDKIIKRKKKITLEDLIQIYDSKGIPPEIVSERAKRYGLEVIVPGNFYSIIAERHGGSRRLVKEKEHELPNDVVEWASRFGETIRVFHEDPYARRTDARILGIYRDYVVFDKTIFYPRAGGQDYDTGYIYINGNERVRVLEAYKVGNVIVHRVDDPGKLVVGLNVVLEIDWYRRYRLMRHHTATHIVLGAARRVLGDHVWQAGAEKTLEKARLDITHYKNLSDEEIRKIEELANRVIDERINLRFHYLPKFEAEEKFDLRIYQGGAVYSPILRIVEIPGWDAEACFGTHVYNTSEIGGIKIINAEKFQDGVIRLEFIASTKLPEYITSLQETINYAKKTLGYTGDLREIINRVRNELENYKRLINDYRGLLREKIREEALRNKKIICGLEIVVLEKKIDDQQLYKPLIEELALKKNYMVIYYDNKIMEIAMNPRKAEELGIDLRKYLREMKLRGGGKRDHVFIRSDNTVKLVNEVIKHIEKTLCKH
jgi:alanyl-tRNA synthetase